MNKIVKIQFTACQELLKKMDLILKPEDNLTKRGFFKEDIFCDGGTTIVILPGLTEYIKNSGELNNLKSMKAGKKFLDKLKLGVEEEDNIEFKKRVRIEEKDFKGLGKREKYVKLSGSKVAVNLYTLRRLKIISSGSMVLTFNRPIDPIRFDSEINRARGYFTPIKYLEDVFPEIGERMT